MPRTSMPNVEIEHVFRDNRPFAQCHAATLLPLSDDRILLAWFGGTRESHGDVAIWAATRTERPSTSEQHSALTDTASWSTPRQIAKVTEEAHWNPVLFSLGEDRGIALHFKVGDSIRRWRTYQQQSLDGGLTWSDAKELVPGDRGGRGAVRCKPILLQGGDWLAGASLERWRQWSAFFDRSKSGTSDWHATKPVQTDRKEFQGKGLIQPTLWESQPGHVHALFRSTAGYVYRSDSDDDGHHWSVARPTSVPNNNSGIDVARLNDGTLALACNPVPGNWAPRTPLSILFSRDNGESWPERIDIETEPGEFSYPALLRHRDGLALAYTWNRRRIAFAEIPKASLPGAA